jgi:signal transduction histidine kinase/CheY-like chemotaxis protein
LAPDWASWRQVAEKLRFRALWSFPVETKGGRVIGVLALFFSQPQTPDDSDIAFNQILAQSAAIIISHQQQKDDRSRAQGALRQAIKMEAIGLLTGGIAHDFNNMLQGVIMGIDVARQKMVSGRLADAMRFLQTARDAALRASGLSRRLLSLAKRQQLEPRRIDPEELIRGMSDLLGRVLGPGIDIVLDLHGMGREVVCDPSELESSILNLCINSRDAMPDGGRLTIATDVSTIPADDDRPGTDPAPGDYLAIRIEDTGKGMSPDVLERALEPFFTSKPPGDGTGLGLSQVQAFASQSGGFLRLESAAGRGTVVRIFLPLAPAQPVGDAGEAIGKPAVGIAAKVNLLLVDDEASVREPIAVWLRDIGYGVVEAVDGATALRKIDEGFRPDVLVTDVGLAGGMDGRALAAEARRRSPGLRVIFITGFTKVPLPDDAPVLVKPFDIDALARLISGVPRGS